MKPSLQHPVWNALHPHREGQLSEILGPKALTSDQFQVMLGLNRAAQLDWQVLRLFRSSNSLSGFLLPPVLLVLCVRIPVGTGVTDSRATPGGDHRNCVSRLRAFQLLLLSINTGGFN